MKSKSSVTMEVYVRQKHGAIERKSLGLRSPPIDAIVMLQT